MGIIESGLEMPQGAPSSVLAPNFKRHPLLRLWGAKVRKEFPPANRLGYHLKQRGLVEQEHGA